MFVHGPHSAHVDNYSNSGSDNEEDAGDIVQVWQNLRFAYLHQVNS
jgi:hypothetical protein